MRANLLTSVGAALDGVGAVIVSDYGKGLVDAEFMAALLAEVNTRSPRPLVLVDPVPANYDAYRGADLITPNAKEAGEGVGLKADGREGVLRVGLGLFKRVRLNHLLITLGPKGMALFEAPDKVLHVPTFARTVFDVTGAGDTVIAVLGLALASGLELLPASVLANYAAGMVVGQVGTAAVTQQELAETIQKLPEPDIARWL